MKNGTSMLSRLGCIAELCRPFRKFSLYLSLAMASVFVDQVISADRQIQNVLQTPYAGFLKITKFTNNVGKPLEVTSGRDMQPVRFVLNAREDGYYYLSATRENFLFNLGEGLASLPIDNKVVFNHTIPSGAAKVKIALTLQGGAIRSGTVAISSTSSLESGEGDLQVSEADPKNVGPFNGICNSPLSSLVVVSKVGADEDVKELIDMGLKLYVQYFKWQFVQVDNLVGFTWTVQMGGLANASQNNRLQKARPAMPLLQEMAYPGLGYFIAHVYKDTLDVLTDDAFWTQYGQADDPYSNDFYRFQFVPKTDANGQLYFHCRLTIHDETFPEFDWEIHTLTEVVGEFDAYRMPESLNNLVVTLDPPTVKAGEFTSLKAQVLDQFNKVDTQFDGSLSIKLLQDKSTPRLARLTADLVSIYRGVSSDVLIFTPYEQFSSSKPITSSTVLSGEAYFEVKLENTDLAPVIVKLEVFSPLNFLIKEIEIQQGIDKQDQSVALPYKEGVNKTYAALPFIADHKTAIMVHVGYENTAAIPFSKIEAIPGFTADLAAYSDGVLRFNHKDIKCGPNSQTDFVFKDPFPSAEKAGLQDGLFAWAWPRDLANPGSYSIEAELKFPSTIKEKDHLDDNKKSRSVQFVSTRQLKIMAVRARYSDTQFPQVPDGIWSYLRVAYPCKSSNIITNDPNTTSFLVDNLWFGAFQRIYYNLVALLNRHNKENPLDQYDRIMMFGDPDFCDRTLGGSTNGCTFLNGKAAILRVLAPTVAHELGHTFGLQDTYVSTGLFSINGEPNPRRRGAASDGNSVEEGGVSLFDENRIVNPDNPFIDLMGASGGLPRWMDRVTYDYLYQNRFKSVAQVRAASLAGLVDGYINVSGVINKNGTAAFQRFLTMASVPDVSPLQSGPYLIEIINKSNQVLSAFPFDVSFAVSELGELSEMLFDFYLVWPSNAATVVLKKNNIEIARRTLSVNAPSVKWKKLQDNDVIKGVYALQWSAADPDKEALTFDLLYSEDGITQTPLAAGLTDSSCQWDTRALAGKSLQTVTIIASDGFNETRASLKHIVVAQEDAALVPPRQLWAAPAKTATRLYWQAPAASGNKIMAGYKIYRSTSPAAARTGQLVTVMLANPFETTVTYSDDNLPAQTYYYQVVASYVDGDSEPSNEVRVVITDIQSTQSPSIPSEHALRQNHPNPFNSSTTIWFDVASASKVHVQIYSLAGVLIKDLVQDRLAAGRQQVVWHADDNNGRSVASGVYLCLMRCETFVQSRKIILIK